MIRGIRGDRERSERQRGDSPYGSISEGDILRLKEGPMKELTKIFKALANERRLRILYLLARGGKETVSSISHNLGLSIRSISKHLLKLEDAGLVARKQTSRWVYYSLNDHPEGEVKYLLKILCKRRGK